MDYHGKVCLITGASSGIGREIALGVARRGGHVGLIARRLDRLEELAEQIAMLGGETEIVAASMAVPEEIAAAVQQVHERWGRLDITIANAGVGVMKSAAKLSTEQVEEMVRVNLLGAIHVLLASLRIMLHAGGGHLVGVSSLGSFRGLPKSSVYSATKAGLNTFLESLRIEYGGQGIKVTCACPGFVDTPMTKGSKLPMPFMLTAEQAARSILQGIEKERTVARFPWQLSSLIRFTQLLPNRMYDHLLRATQPK